MLRRLSLVVPVMSFCLLTQPLLGTDDITIPVQKGQSIGAGFGELTPGPHSLRVTLQANGWTGGMGGGLSDSLGYGMWTCVSSTNNRMTFVCEGSLEDVRGLVTGGGYLYDMMNPMNSGSFTVSIANATFPCASLPYNPFVAMPGYGGSCDQTKEGEIELSPGWCKPVSVKVSHSMPGLVTIEGSNADLKIMTGSGRTASEFAGLRLTGQGMESVTVWLRASRTFSGDKQLRVKFKHDNGPLDTQDVYNVKAGPPRPEALVDLDTDSNNDGSITDADDPIEEVPPGLLLFAIPDAEPGEHGDLGPCQLAVKPQDPSLDLDGYYVVLSATGSASFTLWKDATATEGIAMGTPYPVIPNGTGAPFPSQFVVEATDEGDGEIKAILFDPAGVQVDQDVVLAAAEATQYNRPPVEVMKTYEVPLEEVVRLKAIDNVDDRAKELAALIKAAFKLTDMGLDLRPGETLDSFSFSDGPIGPRHVTGEPGTSLKGISGACMALKCKAKPTPLGMAHDFREGKVRFMAWRVVWDLKDIDSKNVDFQTTGHSVAGPGFTTTHEKWHTDGIDTDFKVRAGMTSLGVMFYDEKPTPVGKKQVPNKPGYRAGAEAYSSAFRAKLGKYKVKPKNVTDAENNWDTLVTANFLGEVPLKGIMDAGGWHALIFDKDGKLVLSNTHVYDMIWWHPKDVLGGPP